jgi:NAD-dependent dihydropyrimidine dehydrogenase PreA subunit
MEGEVPVVVDIERCTRCLQCEFICPDFAIEVSRDEEKKP